MAATYEIEVTVSSAKDLKNVNWRHGSLKPYAVVWVDRNQMFTTKADENGDEKPVWDHTLIIPVPPSTNVRDSKLTIDVVHAGGEEGTKPNIGSATVSLEDIITDAGINNRAKRTLKLKRPSGRPQGKLEATITVKENLPAPPPPPVYAQPAYGVPSQQPTYGAPAYGAPSYGAPPAQPVYGAPGYGAPPAQPAYAAPSYGAPPVQTTYGAHSYGQPVAAGTEQKKKGGIGKAGAFGLGIAAGGVAAVAGGLLAHEVEDHIADKAAEKATDNLTYGAAYYDSD